MRKFLVIVALMLFIAPFAYAGSKVLEMHDSTSSVINTVAIQEIELDGSIIFIMFNYSSLYRSYHYTSKAQAQQKYRELVQIMKQNSVNECLRYGGGKACYMN